VRRRNGHGKSSWHRRIVLPRLRPCGAGPVVSRTPWGYANSFELRGIALAAGGEANRVQPVPRGERLLRGFQAGVDGQLSRPGPRCDDGTVYGRPILRSTLTRSIIPTAASPSCTTLKAIRLSSGSRRGETPSRPAFATPASAYLQKACGTESPSSARWSSPSGGGRCRWRCRCSRTSGDRVSR